MCHAAPLAAFSAEGPSEPIDDVVAAWAFGEEGPIVRLAVLPDIYGCTPFYRGFASHLAMRNARVFLVDPFEGLGDLPETTREAAFARRHRLRDRASVDRIESFARKRALTGIVGFCLGGLYVFELARRALPAKLVGFYGFPQGLVNADPLPRPLDYLDGLSTPHTAL